VRKFFRPHLLPASLAVLLCLAACGGQQEQPPPKFNPGDPVYVGAEGLPGQVLEVVPQHFPYRYVVRYLPPPQSAVRDFRKDIFEEIELKKQ
jgi:multidrug efflux pump subunit AcrA (membrane-fusion protein)